MPCLDAGVEHPQAPPGNTQQLHPPSRGASVRGADSSHSDVPFLPGPGAQDRATPGCQFGLHISAPLFPCGPPIPSALGHILKRPEVHCRGCTQAPWLEGMEGF